MKKLITVTRFLPIMRASIRIVSISNRFKLWARHSLAILATHKQTTSNCTNKAVI